MIVQLCIVNNSYGMSKLAKLLSCVSPQYSEVDSGNSKKVTDFSQDHFEIKLSDNPTLNILRTLDKKKQNSWVARLVDQPDCVVEVRQPVTEFVNDFLTMQRFEIIGKQPGIATLKLLEIVDRETVKMHRLTIAVIQ